MGKKVLIVDDSTTFRMMLRRTLTATGFPIESVAEAGNAAEGLERYLAEPADVVLLDLNMPCGDGVDLVAEFKRSSRTSVVLITAEVNEERIRLARDRGADGYLRKPFFPEKLKGALARFLS